MQQFSCSHWATDIDDNGILVALKAHDVDETDGGYVNAIHYATYCTDCYNYADKMNRLLHNDAEEMDWLRGEDV